MKNNERTETVTTADTAVVTKPNYKSIKNKVLATTFALAVNACLISSVSAAGGAVDASAFISTACTVLKSVIILIGGGVGVLGIVNLLEAYGGDNASARSQGMKQLMAGLGLILLAIVLVPVLQNMMTAAV